MSNFFTLDIIHGMSTYQTRLGHIRQNVISLSSRRTVHNRRDPESHLLQTHSHRTRR